jgi:hypothetical protein
VEGEGAEFERMERMKGKDGEDKGSGLVRVNLGRCRHTGDAREGDQNGDGDLSDRELDGIHRRYCSLRSPSPF